LAAATLFRDRRGSSLFLRVPGLNLLVAAITLWNTRYLNRAIAPMRETEDVPDHLLGHLSPLGWEHINLTGDYVWSADEATENRDGFRFSPTCARSKHCWRHEFPLCPLMRIGEVFRYLWPYERYFQERLAVASP
jgi:Tn3 transposase DDE domain